MNRFSGIERGSYYYWLVVISLFVLALTLRWPLLDPPGLWMDDARAALVVKTDNVSDFLLVTSHVPVLLSLVIKVVGTLFPDKELGPQLFPVFLSCLSVPLFFLVVVRITGSVAVGLVSAFALAFNPMSIFFSAQIKPYPGDIVATIGHLYFFSVLVSDKLRFSPKGYALFCVISFLFSFTSVIVAGAFYLVWLVFLVFDRKWNDVRPFFWSAGISSVFLGIYYWAFLGRQGSPAVKAFWSASFVPVGEPVKALIFVGVAIKRALESALDAHIIVLSVLLLLSVFAFKKNERGTKILLFFVSVYMVAVCLSAFKLYPLNGARTGSYLLPLNILLLCAGLGLLEKVLPRGLIRLVLFLVPIALFAQYKQKDLKYLVPGDYHIKPLVKVLEMKYRNGDAIVCWSHANWGLGYYTNWAIRFIPTDQFGAGYAASLNMSYFYLLNDNKYFQRENLSMMEDAAGRYKRIWFIAAFYDADVTPLGNALLQRGFVVSKGFNLPGAFLRLYER